MKRIIKKIPVLNGIARSIYRTFNPIQPFEDSESYWIERYKSGDNSGDGSYNNLALFKAEIINDFVKNHGVSSVIEFGSGDGNQLKLSEYPSYVGFDVSPDAIKICKEIFNDDQTKDFKLIDEYTDEKAELTLSLDVIYHLIEDETFNEYMERLFRSSEKYVIVYSSNTDENPDDQLAHVKHRKFTNWIDENRPDWEVKEHIPNKIPYDYETEKGSFADFYIYAKQ